MAEESQLERADRSARKSDKNEDHAASEGHVMAGTESVYEETISAVEELEKNAEDWVNRLPEALQDEP